MSRRAYADMGRRRRRRLREAGHTRPTRRSRPSRGIDQSPGGQAAAALRLAEPIAPMTVAELDRLGVGAGARAEARRWRRCTWVVDYGVERLEALGLLETEWLKMPAYDGGELGDWQIRLLRDRLTGRAVLAAVCTPSAREQLDWLWDTLHEYAAGSIPGDDYFWRAGPRGVLADGFWFSGWLRAL